MCFDPGESNQNAKHIDTVSPHLTDFVKRKNTFTLYISIWLNLNMGKDPSKTYTIGQLAKAAEVNIQTVRFYERKGILKPARRLESKYRLYDSDSLKRLQFIKQAKAIGFSLHEIQSLLDLRVRSIDRCNQVRTKAERKIEDVRQRIFHLKKLERTLKGLISDCNNRVVSDCCPIIERMES